jgi:hypothetical protein
MEQPTKRDYEEYMKDSRQLCDYLKDESKEMLRLLRVSRSRSSDGAVLDYVRKFPEDYIEALDFKGAQITKTLLFAQEKAKGENSDVPDKFSEVLSEARVQCKKGIKLMRQLHLIVKTMSPVERPILPAGPSDGTKGTALELKDLTLKYDAPSTLTPDVLASNQISIWLSIILINAHKAFQ